MHQPIDQSLYTITSFIPLLSRAGYQNQKTIDRVAASLAPTLHAMCAANGSALSRIKCLMVPVIQSKSTSVAMRQALKAIYHNLVFMFGVGLEREKLQLKEVLPVSYYDENVLDDIISRLKSKKLNNIGEYITNTDSALNELLLHALQTQKSDVLLTILSRLYQYIPCRKNLINAIVTNKVLAKFFFKQLDSANSDYPFSSQLEDIDVRLHAVIDDQFRNTIIAETGWFSLFDIRSISVAIKIANNNNISYRSLKMLYKKFSASIIKKCSKNPENIPAILRVWNYCATKNRSDVIVNYYRNIDNLVKDLGELLDPSRLQCQKLISSIFRRVFNVKEINGQKIKFLKMLIAKHPKLPMLPLPNCTLINDLPLVNPAREMHHLLFNSEVKLWHHMYAKNNFTLLKCTVLDRINILFKNSDEWRGLLDGQSVMSPLRKHWVLCKFIADNFKIVNHAHPFVQSMFRYYSDDYRVIDLDRYQKIIVCLQANIKNLDLSEQLEQVRINAQSKQIYVPKSLHSLMEAVDDILQDVRHKHMERGYIFTGYLGANYTLAGMPQSKTMSLKHYPKAIVDIKLAFDIFIQEVSAGSQATSIISC